MKELRAKLGLIHVDEYNIFAREKGFSPLLVHNDAIYGFWLIGQNYRSVSSDFYGSFPRNLLTRLEKLVPALRTGKVLHLFSGTMKGDGKRIFTLDINPELKPDFCGDAEDVDRLCPHDFFDVVLADPPYGENWRKYPYVKKAPNKKRIVERTWYVLKLGGLLIWLDTIIPMWSKRQYRWRGAIGIGVSTNHVVRSLVFLEKKGEPILNEVTLEKFMR